MGIALQHEALARSHLGHDIRARTDRDLQRLILEMLRIGVGARKDRHQRKNHRQFPIISASQIAANGQRVESFDAFDEAKRGALLGRPFCFKRLKVNATSCDVIAAPSENRARGSR